MLTVHAAHAVARQLHGVLEHLASPYIEDDEA